MQFFQNNPALELLKDNIAVYIANTDNNAFAGIASQDQPAVLAHARSMQRVLRIAPDPDSAETLLTAGLTSATQIAAMGQQRSSAQQPRPGLRARTRTRHIGPPRSDMPPSSPCTCG